MALIKSHGRTISASIGIIAVSAVIMSGCSAGDGDAEFAEATETASSLKPVDPELLTIPKEDDLGKIVSTDAIDAGDEGRIVVPSGELKVSGISSVEQVPASVIANGVAPEDAAPSEGEGVPSEAAPSEASSSASDSGEDLGPAEGKKLSLVSVSYTSNDTGQDPAFSAGDDESANTADLASPTLALDLDGQTRKLPKLDEDGQRTYLMSIPADGAAEFVVTQDGHEQRLDLNTGKRLADEVASTYYRDKAEPVEINEPLAFPDTTVTVGIGGNSNTYDKKVELTTELATAHLTPWTKKEGWADAGTAWLVVDGKAGIEAEGNLTPSKAKITYSIAANGEEEADFAVATDDFSDKSSEVVSVPVDIEKLEVTGSAKINLKATASDIQGDNPRTVKTKQPYEIDFGAPASTQSGPDDDTSSSAPVETAVPEN
ncbi:hypothetical protein [Brevibacterium aurantiacum]|uniref:hypothetical protein n=1 Tax=Brevibacterium aurantiacum TaxID=273384 RepID=UPI003F931645